MNRSAQLWAIHATGVVVLLCGGAFCVAGWLPPPSPNQSLEVIARYFQDNTKLRIAGAMLLFGGAFYVAPCVAYGAQMRRMDDGNAVLARIQELSAAIGVIALQMPGVLWLAGSFYPNLSGSVLVTLNSTAWFMLLGAVAPLMIQELCVAACILHSKTHLYPRWLGYLGLLCAADALPGVFIPFAKTGPLAWDGVICFWLVAVAFFTWILLMWIYTVKAINRDDPVDPAGASPAIGDLATAPVD